MKKVLLVVMLLNMYCFGQTYISVSCNYIPIVAYEQNETDVEFIIDYVDNPLYSGEYLEVHAYSYSKSYKNEENPLPQVIEVPLHDGRNKSITFKLRGYNKEMFVWENIQVLWEHVNVGFQMVCKNNFGSGIMSVDGQIRNHGYHLSTYITDTVYVSAIENQSIDGYKYVWKSEGEEPSYWERFKYGYSYVLGDDKDISFTVYLGDKDNDIVNHQRKVCNVAIQNTLGLDGNTGVIKINGDVHNSPISSYDVIEKEYITIEALEQSSNSIDFTFDRWEDGDTSNPRTFQIDEHQTIKAIYKGKPNNTYRNQRYGTRYGDPIKIIWNEHPSTNVTKYAIWRRVKDGNGFWGEQHLVTTVNRGTTQYTDQDFYLTSGYTDELIYYDIRAYYQPSEMYATVDLEPVFGNWNEKALDSLDVCNNDIKEYDISNYPNPFNPTTTITYQMPEDGLVKLTVFNILGKEVKTLVNTYQTRGVYNVSFNASDLPTGFYIYRIHVNNFSKTKKMLLVK